MATVLLIIHIMIALALIGVVLLQRSEGGALGIGGGGGGFMTGRGAANFLTRVTAGLAAAFFATSMLLSLVATRSRAQRSIFDAPGIGTGRERAEVPAGTAPQLPPSTRASPSHGTAQRRARQLRRAPSGPRVPQSK